MKKRIISLALTLCITLSLLPTYAAAMSRSVFAGGDGTEDNPYQIETPEQLDAVRNDMTAHYLLISDIDMRGYNWIPIGYAYDASGEVHNSKSHQAFEGSLNGNNHVISNLSITSSFDYDTIGLFGFARNCTLLNIVLKNLNISIRKTKDYTPEDNAPIQYVCVGGIVGNCGASVIINACNVSGTIDVEASHCNSIYIGGISGNCNSIQNSTNKADMIVKNSNGDIYCGGISGNSSDVSNCVNYGNISATTFDFLYCGGVVGDGNVKSSANYGSINGEVTTPSGNSSYASHCNVGGIIGRTCGSNSNCINYGNISAAIKCVMIKYTVLYNCYAGGIAGWVGYDSGGSLLNCYNLADRVDSVLIEAPDGYFGTAGRITGVLSTGSDLYSVNTSKCNNAIPTEYIGSDKINGESLTLEEMKAKIKGLLFPEKTELIYRAAMMNNLDTPAEQAWAYLSYETPADLLIKSAHDHNLDLSVGAWKAATVALDAFDDPTAVVDVVLEPKDIYSGLIMKVLEASMDIDLVNDLYEDAIKDSDEYISAITDFAKTEINLDFSSRDAFQNMSPEQQRRILEISGDWFDKKQPDAADLGSVFTGFTMAFKAINTIEDFYKLLASYLAIENMSEYMKAALNAAYQESLKTDNYYLQSAFSDCVQAANQGFAEKFLENGAFVLGKEPAKYLFKEFVWNNVKKAISPGAAFVLSCANLSKSFANCFFASDDIQNAYQNLTAIQTVESVFKAANETLSHQFSSERSTASAGAYLSALELAFNAIDVDCEQAYEFVDTVDSAKISQFVNYLTGSNLSNKKNNICSQQKDYQSVYNLSTSAWKHYLVNGYNPFTGQYDYSFVPTCNTSDGSTAAWQIVVACPVDVYVYNTAGNLVASVIGGTLECEDENLIIACVGDEKTVRFFNNSQYRVECVGSDTSCMDVTVQEYDAKEVTRTVQYVDIALSDGKQYSLNKTTTNDSYELVETATNQAVHPAFDTDSSNSHVVSMKNGTFSYKGNIALQGEVPAGATVSVATETPEGYAFVGWQASNGENLFENSNALNTTFVMPDEDITIQAVFQEIAVTNPFKDVPNGKFFTDAVLWAVSHDPQITTGVTDTTFMPDRVCTRAHVVTFLWRANGCPEPKATTNSFKDVPNGKYYTKAVLWASEQGITTGYSDGTFRPDAECTRAQVVTFLWRANGSPKPERTDNPFQDVSSSAYYAKAVLWALETGVTTGKTATAFNPDGECTRAHVVTFLYRDMA